MGQATPAGTDTDHLSTSQLLSVAATCVSHAWNERLAQLHVSHASVVTLGELKTSGPLRQMELAARLRITGQTLGRMLQGLEERGFVARMIGVNGDNRQVLVSITPHGTDTLAQAEQLGSVLEAQLGDGLRADLLRILPPNLS